MSRFLQLHLLTFYPPSNVNRDDAGRPKTALVGGHPRLRISSQALKRAWRTSEGFAQRVGENRGKRTQRLGEEVILPHLLAKGVARERAEAVVREIIPVFGKAKAESDPNKLRTEQLFFVSPEEREAALDLAERLAAGGGDAKVEAKALLRHSDTATDIAMFGRMLADNPAFNRDAAVQVAHAFTTHRAPVEDDYYVAVDDLKTAEEDAGAGFIGEQGFGSGMFYLYLCVDRALLLKNLGGDAALAGTAMAALVEAAATVAPTGKQNAFAARARAHYMLAERGDDQPRTLAAAFAKPVQAERGVVEESVRLLTETRGNMDRAYGLAALDHAEMDVAASTGTLAEVVAFCESA